MPVFQISPEFIRAQVVNDLRKAEQQSVKQICSDALRRIVVQNYRDLAAVLNRVGRE